MKLALFFIGDFERQNLEHLAVGCNQFQLVGERSPVCTFRQLVELFLRKRILEADFPVPIRSVHECSINLCDMFSAPLPAPGSSSADRWNNRRFLFCLTVPSAGETEDAQEYQQNASELFRVHGG